jgi:hypothetical protein
MGDENGFNYDQDPSIDERRRKGCLHQHHSLVKDPVFTMSSPSLCVAPQTYRYNNIRPNYLIMGRVNGYNYPPPDQHGYGWVFTGSCHNTKAEFYQMETELGRVYLDFFYTDGTVKTVLDHEIEGNMVLFAKGRSLLPDIYIQILRDPLATTDTKYRRRCLFS